MDGGSFAMKFKKMKITIELDEFQYARMEKIAKRKGITAEQYCGRVINSSILRDSAPSKPPDPDTVEARMKASREMDELRKQIWGDRVMPSSTPFIRKMRGHED